VASGAGKYCNNGGCVACLRDADCASGQHCQTLFGLDICQ
jgi:Cys-rich repeat protein